MEVLVPSQTILEKLQLKEERNLLIQGLPSTIEKQFIKLSFAKNITPLLKVKKIDFALVFAISKHQLRDILKDVLPALNENAKLWIAYPKLTSKIVSDLSRDCNWECVAQLGYEAVRMISLDHVWCAMRFKKAEQVKHIFEDTIHSEFVDKNARVITTPYELENLFIVNTEAKAFFDGLSFSNKKEYVVWINGSKKEDTKLARLKSTIEKLNNGKKNPSDK
ncbi:YdeI/OmpD-associated family protein [Ferruginibacter sp.]|uniref:YdeI/OmpD-associated family protein n=1 Tax=Ferruginibacter sp. TaxID=1940288 RepID=UPI00198AFF5F|nr:YdeI/OmpD-associated family protein [Ferruginibacter sp.]MBC7627201.1 YdeI/OmpD-associated family protein [Ferruginibacter sp.]